MGRINAVLNLDREDRKQIDRMLVQGKSRSLISQQFGVSVDTLRNYESVHMAGGAAAGFNRSLKSHTENLFNELLELSGITKEILVSAMDDNHRGLSLKAVQQVRNNLEVLTKFILSMETMRMKQDTIVEARDDRSQEIISHGLKALSPQERKEYRRLNIKMLAAWNGDNQGSLNPDPDTDVVPTYTQEGDSPILTRYNEPEQPEIDYRVDADGHSLKPVRSRPRPRNVDTGPGRTTPRPEDLDLPMTRTTPRV